MKKQEKKMILILAIVAIALIAIMIGATRGKKEENKGTQGEVEQNIAQGEFTKIEEDGTIVNTSEKLKETKENVGFTITDIKFMEKDNETILTARITNNTEKTQSEFFGKIVLLDKKGNEIGEIPVMIPETQSGEAIDVETTITESYANAYDFRLEK